jgi:serine/threonine protein kinase
MRCLETDPSKRYTLRDILNHPWMTTGDIRPIHPNDLKLRKAPTPTKTTIEQIAAFEQSSPPANNPLGSALNGVKAQHPLSPPLLPMLQKNCPIVTTRVPLFPANQKAQVNHKQDFKSPQGTEDTTSTNDNQSLSKISETPCYAHVVSIPPQQINRFFI